MASHPLVNPPFTIDYSKQLNSTNNMSSFVKILALVPLALAASPVMMVSNQVRLWSVFTPDQFVYFLSRPWFSKRTTLQ